MTDYYISRKGETQGGQKYANISMAGAGKTYEQAVFSSDPWRWASTYNSPKDAFDTIIYRQLKSTSVGDIVTLKIYKGYIPDLGDTDQPTLPDRNLDSANLMASKSVTMTATAATDYVFQFDQEFSDVNLTSQIAGDAPQFTVFQETTNSGGTVITAHRTLFAVRTVVPIIFTSPEDFGPDTDSGNGGAGNTHGASNGTFFGNSGSALDRPLALEFLKSTDIPLGDDSATGNGIDNPYATYAGFMSAVNNQVTAADSVFFRAGTYSDALAFGSSGDSILDLNGVGRNPAFFGAYADEKVIFEMPSDKNYFVSKRNIATAADNTEYLVKNIHFRTGYRGHHCAVAMLRTEHNTANTKICTLRVDGCQFDQTNVTTEDLVKGALVSEAVGENTSVIWENCIINCVDIKCFLVSNQKKEFTMRNCTVTSTAPTIQANDSNSTPLGFLGAASAQDQDLTVNLLNNKFVLNIGGSTNTSQMLQLDYINYSNVCNNEFVVNPLDPDNVSINQAPIMTTVRYANQSLADYPSNKRNIKEARYVGNTITYNHAKGGAIGWYRAAGKVAVDAGSKFLFQDNKITGNAAYRPSDSSTNLQTYAIDSLTSYLSEFKVVGNTVSLFQDCCRLRGAGTAYTIEDNTFENFGSNGAASSTVAIALWCYSDIDSAELRRNRFIFSEFGTAAYLGDSSQAANLTLEDNTFYYPGPPIATNNKYVAWYLPSSKLGQLTSTNNRYIGLDKIGDTTLFLHSTTGDIGTDLTAGGETAYSFTNLTSKVGKGILNRNIVSTVAKV